MSSGPEIRIDQLTGTRSVLAAARAERPESFEARPPESNPGAAERCPFCEGREDRTPPEVWADRPEGPVDSPGWRARSVPNLYPMLGAAEGSEAAGSGPAEPGQGARDPLGGSARGDVADLFASGPATGAHEVIINSPEHAISLSELDDSQLAATVAAWRERMRAHERASLVHLIVNQGPEAGASLEHTHAQVYALDFVPPLVARERERAAAHHERTMGGNLLGDVLVEEVRRRERLVAIDDDAALICPWVSRGPYELRIVPRRPEPRFERDGESVGVGMLRAALRALEACFDGVPQLNLWVRTAPRGAETFCWHIDIVPRLAIRAGFELGTGIETSSFPPERAAADLRDALS